MKIDLQKLRQTAEVVTKRNASAKRGHPKYTASVTSAEEFELTHGVLVLLGEVERLQAAMDGWVQNWKDQVANVERERASASELYEQLVDMTKARDEACDLIERAMPYPTFGRDYARETATKLRKVGKS
jgi:hypothetical protein